MRTRRRRADGKPERLFGDAQIEYVKGANHFTVFDWRGDAYDEIVREAHALLPAGS